MKIIIYLIIFFISLIQVIYQPLLQDEAYYYFYSTSLSVGYFDHPPMVGWSIALGTLFFHSEWAIRLVYLGYLMGTVFILDKLVSVSNNWKYLFLFSFPLINVLHLALPDSSLLFFTTLFFYVFKICFLDGKRTFFHELLLSILLSIIIALMIYSKYHALITLFFTMLAFPAVFKKWNFYFIVCLTTGIVVPHFLWQVNFDFVTFQYHFFERSESIFDVQNVIDFSLSSLFIVFGLFFLFIPSWIKKSNYNSSQIPHFKRVLLFNILGFFLFFLYFSIKGAVEINWMFSASIPAIILLGNHLNFSNLWVKTSIGFSIGTFIIFRVMLISNTIPQYGYLYEVSGYEDWAKDINKRFENKQVIFQDSYQLASLYAYYNHQVAFSYNTSSGRMNHYSISNNDVHFQNKDVVIIQPWKEWYSPIDTFHTQKGIFQFYEIMDFYCINNIQFKEPKIQHIMNDEYEFQVEYVNRGNYPLQQLMNTEKLQLVITKVIPHHLNTIVLHSNAFKIFNNQLIFKVNLPNPLDFEKYRLGFSYNNQPASGNSMTFKLPFWIKIDMQFTI